MSKGTAPPEGGHRSTPTLVDTSAQRRHRKIRRRLRNALVLFLLSATLLLLIFRDDIDYYSLGRRLFGGTGQVEQTQRVTQVPQNLDSGLAACAIRNNVVLALNNRLVSYRTDSSLALDEPISLTTPALAESERYLLAYDRGGRSALLSNGRTVLTQLTTEDEIQMAAVGNNGTFALVSEGQGVLSLVSVYSRRGNLRYQWQSASGRVSSAALSEDGNTLAVASFSAADATLVSTLRLQDVSGNQTLATLQLEDELVLSMTVRDGVLTLVTDLALYFYGARDGTLRQRLPHGIQPLMRFSLEGGGAVLMLGQYAVGQGGRLLSYGTDGQLQADVQCTGDIRSLVAGEDRVVLLQSGSVTIMDRLGASLQTLERPSVRQAVLLRSGAVALIGASSIERVG